jgi:hypothetical protein
MMYCWCYHCKCHRRQKIFKWNFGEDRSQLTGGKGEAPWTCGTGVQRREPRWSGLGRAPESRHYVVPLRWAAERA